MDTTPMLDGERADDYTRRTGAYPSHWSITRMQMQNCKIDDATTVAARGINSADRARARRYLRRWGAAS